MTFVAVNQGSYHVSYYCYFFPAGNDVRVGGEYPLIRVFINVFSSRATGFHRHSRFLSSRFHPKSTVGGYFDFISPISPSELTY